MRRLFMWGWGGRGGEEERYFLGAQESNKEGSVFVGRGLFPLVRSTFEPPFFCGKTSVVSRCGTERITPLRRLPLPLVSPKLNGDATTQQADCACAIARVKRAEKESGNHRSKLACSRGVRSPFSSACHNIHANKTQAFGWGLGRCFGLPKQPPLRPLTSPSAPFPR